MQLEKIDINSKLRNFCGFKNESIKLEMPINNRQTITELMYPNLDGYWSIVNGNLKKNEDEFDFDDYGWFLVDIIIYLLKFYC